MARKATTPRNTRSSVNAKASAKSNPKTPTAMSEAHLGEVELPKAVYFRYRYRLAVKANNLGKAQYYENRLKAMEEPLKVKNEFFTSTEGATKWLAAQEAPVAAKAAKPATEKTAKQSKPVVESNKKAEPSLLSKMEDFKKLVELIKTSGISEADAQLLISKAALQLIQ